jgi:hypothetical protein
MSGVRLQAHSYISSKKATATLHLQGRRFTLRKQQPSPMEKTYRERGIIKEFSRQSRRRLFDLLNSLDKSLEKAIFVTLTYGQSWPDSKTVKKHLDNFLKRVSRRFPGASGVWRLEFQQRGAPHFHLLLFNMPFWDKHALADAWFEIVGDEYADNSQGEPRAPFTRIEACLSYKHITRYLSKYVAKVGDVGLTSSHISPPGRFWGVFNRSAIPYAPLEAFEYRLENTASQIAYADFLRGIRRKVRGIRTNPRGGITIYSENIHRWRQYLDYLIDNCIS